MSLYSTPPAPALGILPLSEGKGMGGSEQGRDRKPVAEEQEVVVGVHPAAVCSHCVLITKVSRFLASERPPRLAGRGLTKVPRQVSVSVKTDTCPSAVPAASWKTLCRTFTLGTTGSCWEWGGGTPTLPTDRSEGTNLSAVRQAKTSRKYSRPPPPPLCPT